TSRRTAKPPTTADRNLSDTRQGHRGCEFDPAAGFGRARVLRGASFATRARLRSMRRRGFALPWRDDGFLGFRTCAL
ncbi:hypothetical protein ACEN8K_17055, partial [Variovorax sp. CT11-76]